MAEQGVKRRGQAASVAVHVSEEQQFIADQLARPRAPRHSGVEGESDGMTQGGVVTHIAPNMVTMYKPTPQGYQPRSVPVTSIQTNLINGWKRVCPDCNGHHGSDANACPGRSAVAIRVCPVCSKRVPDPGVTVAEQTDDNDDDPNVIPYIDESTPAQRSLVAWLIHMWLRHPRESLERGLQPLDPSYIADLKSGAQPSEAFAAAGSHGIVS